MADNNAFTDLGVENSYMGNPEDLELFFSDKSPEDIEKEKQAKLAKEKEELAKKGKIPIKKGDEPDQTGEEVIDSIEEENKEEETLTEEQKAEAAKTEETKPTDLEAFTNDLFKLNILTKDDEDNGKTYKTDEELITRFNREKEKGAYQWLDSFLGQFGEDRHELFNAVFIDGVDPKEYLPIYNKLNDYRQLDISTEDNQKKVFREFYSRIGMDDSTIAERLQKTIDYGDLEKESKVLHGQLVSQDEKRAAQITEESSRKTANDKAFDESYRRGVQSVLVEKLKEKELNGFPINEQSAKKVADMLITKKYKSPSGELLTEFDKMILDTKRPENISRRILFALIADANFDLSKVEKKAISKESSSLFTSLTNKNKKGSGAAISTSAAPSIWDKI